MTDHACLSAGSADVCKDCGLERREHHLDGAAYGVCGQFSEIGHRDVAQPTPITAEDIAKIIDPDCAQALVTEREWCDRWQKNFETFAAGYISRWEKAMVKAKAIITIAAQPPAAPVETTTSDGSLSEGNANVGDRIGRTRRPAHPMDTISGGPIGPSDLQCSAGNASAREVLSEIVDYFAASGEGAGGEWAHPDDLSSYCLDFHGQDGAKFWLDLHRDGIIHLMWKRGAAMRSMNFGLITREPQTSPTREQLAQAFETIRLKLVNCLEEPERSAFWLAVRMRDALAPTPSHSGE
jgi:hypothetical protein